MVDLSVNRLSEQADVIPLMVSERLMDVHKDLRGSTIEAVGQFRSYNRHEGVKNRLMLSVFAREIRFLDEFTDYTRTNQIFLDGYICKPPIYRKTLLDERLQIFCWQLTVLWKIRLHTLYQLGKKCPLCLRLYGRHPSPYLGKSPEQGIYKKAQRDRV